MDNDVTPEAPLGDAAFWAWKPDRGLAAMIRADWAANKTTPKGRVVMVMFRLASWARRTNRLTLILGFPYLIFYRLLVEWVLGVEIPPLTRIGAGFEVHHGQGIVINNRTVIGQNCLIRHGVTLGNARDEDIYGCPVIGDCVSIGASALVLGRVTVGNEVVIGAGSVVLKDIAAGSLVVGNPAKAVNKKP